MRVEGEFHRDRQIKTQGENSLPYITVGQENSGNIELYYKDWGNEVFKRAPAEGSATSLSQPCRNECRPCTHAGFCGRPPQWREPGASSDSTCAC